jgi:hypothetical protein
MRLTISVDNYSHSIDSTDPELLGKWIVEIFSRAVAGGMNQNTYIQVQAYPSFVPDGTPGGKLDWIADSRIIGGVFQPHSPQELLAALAQQLKDAEDLHE